MSMPPQPCWYQGRDAVGIFLGLRPLAAQRHFRLTTITASGQPALAAYIWDEKMGAFEAESILVLTFRDSSIEEITAFRNPELFSRFGLPGITTCEGTAIPLLTTPTGGREMPARDLTGTTAIVTGASRGFGRATSIALAELGAHVVGVARNEELLGELAAQLGDRFTAEVADAADPSVAARLISGYRPQILILNAGATPAPAPVSKQTWETFSINWNTDVRHVFNFTRQALTAPLEPGSVVVSLSSGAALNGSPLSGGYAGAKATVRFISTYAGVEAQRTWDASTPPPSQKRQPHGGSGTVLPGPSRSAATSPTRQRRPAYPSAPRKPSARSQSGPGRAVLYR
jgi:NAD(P)-dependent dehydrogenase (short-subunit alcohol dehydrogenase family)